MYLFVLVTVGKIFDYKTNIHDMASSIREFVIKFCLYREHTKHIIQRTGRQPRKAERPTEQTDVHHAILAPHTTATQNSKRRARAK